MPTLPTGTFAPRLAGQPGDPAPTVPMRVARVPDSLLAATRNAPTLPTVGASSATIRAESDKARARVIWLVVLLVGAALLAGGAYVALHVGSHPPTRPKPPPAAAVTPPPVSVVEQSDAGTPHADSTPGTVEPPARPAVRPPPSSDDPPSRHRSTLQVTFVRKRPSQINISCGTPARPCADVCTVSTGESCLARSPGFQSRRMTFEELKGRGNKARTRYEVKLSTAQ
jgi:hypothetical protein